MASKLWEKNFEINQEIERFTVGKDREMDLYLAKYDVLGSMAHITMLESIGLLDKDELAKLLDEMGKIGEILAGLSYFLDSRVANVSRLIIPLLIPVGLKGQDTIHVVDITADVLDAPFLPNPHLG